MSRPTVVVGVAGTATDVGKTFVGAALAAALRRRGRHVAARKPVQSFAPDDPAPTDGAVLAEATGEDPDRVCAPDRSLALPMAPPMAADVLGVELAGVAELAELDWPDEVIDVGLVESVGGVRSPVAGRGDSRDLLRAAGVDLVVLVADATLGTIDRTRLAVDALAPLRTIVVLNRFDADDELHERNRRWLVEVDGYDVVTGVSELADLIEGNRPRT